METKWQVVKWNQWVNEDIFKNNNTETNENKNIGMLKKYLRYNFSSKREVYSGTCLPPEKGISS